ncbi:D-alanine--D-alanine ligase family protein [Streptomyces albireticuli]|uniref:D-alanine--D-alanine ligase n=1 Tax=Streptomyces albireticuli TaxID=1940 RepID=A0A2A2DBI7_9ACTN|nr:D-alanine--D-alanine ligase [Streptomyces albireticuli]MCD9145471.1 D-alanine--D-alanine ligase [Streptomyces albireticuli]MCD9164964.1 D-alanine--D-alanine ligase [Streptomyces albireticuli]MCD9195445.1 D-alanine--D-alanine ligase [Streptomyces albireticuli]PAU48730.1 D-alanine--D-alanine ligase [Streptomyces albireticuli]
MLETPTLPGQRIGVLCGGESPERPGSIASGEAALKSLTAQGLHAELIDLTGLDLGGLRDRIDVALIASHGPGGEDGKLQGALETLGISYTGSGVLASAVGMDKVTTKNLLRAEGIDTPKAIAIHPSWSTATATSSVQHSLGFPVFVKPVAGGGSLASGIAHDANELDALLERARQRSYERYMAEEYIPGTPCSAGILEVGGKLTVLPLLDVEVNGRPFYDYEAKHDRALRTEHCPSNLPEAQTKVMEQVALRVHRLVGAHGVSRVDFLCAPSGRMPVLEINTVPGLSQAGNLATMAQAGGIGYDELIRHLVATAFSKPAYVP